MSGRPAVEVQGLRTLRRTLKAAGLSLQDLKDAHADVARVVVVAAAPRAPRRTGKLVSTDRGSGTQSAAVVRAGGARVPYAGPIHWGWPARHIKAQPWLYDAAVASQQRWEGVYLTALEHIIDKIEGAPGP
ncbi:MAG: HK97 gp10 family phage protein [Mycobacterium sp.]